MTSFYLSSLQRISLLNITTSLWQGEDSISQVIVARSNFQVQLTGRQSIPEAWLPIQENVLQKVERLNLPEVLKSKIKNAVTVVGVQIFKWIGYHKDTDPILEHRNLVNQLQWTIRCTIDNKKTAEMIVKDHRLTLFKRYSFACLYCLENEINALWKALLRDDECSRRIKETGSELVLFWTRKMYETDDDQYEQMLRKVAIRGNSVATEYFVRKLDSLGTTDVLVRVAAELAEMYSDTFWVSDHALRKINFKDYFSNTMYVLLSGMNALQLEQLFATSSYFVLQSLLHWQWRDVFAVVAHNAWGSLRPVEFLNLLRYIVGHVEELECFDGDEYWIIFRSLWMASPEEYRHYAIENIGHIISRLSDSGSSTKWNILELILDGATAEEKFHIVFRKPSPCESMIYFKKYDMMQFIIRKCVPLSSRSELKRLEELYKPEPHNRRTNEPLIHLLVSELIEEYDLRAKEANL